MTNKCANFFLNFLQFFFNRRGIKIEQKRITFKVKKITFKEQRKKMRKIGKLIAIDSYKLFGLDCLGHTKIHY
jgi:hypothetical protein